MINQGIIRSSTASIYRELVRFFKGMLPTTLSHLANWIRTKANAGIKNPIEKKWGINIYQPHIKLFCRNKFYLLNYTVFWY